MILSLFALGIFVSPFLSDRRKDWTAGKTHLCTFTDGVRSKRSDTAGMPSMDSIIRSFLYGVRSTEYSIQNVLFIIIRVWRGYGTFCQRSYGMEGHINHISSRRSTVDPLGSRFLAYLLFFPFF